MRKASELKKGDAIKIADKSFLVEETEISDIGKQGKRKVRLVIKSETGEKLVLVRPEDYPFS